VTPIPIVVSALAGALRDGADRHPPGDQAVRLHPVGRHLPVSGVIPLGLALQETGGAELIADLLVLAAPALPALVVVLGLVYVVTALLTNVISNNASVVLMIPVAAEAAVQLAPTPSRLSWR